MNIKGKTLLDPAIHTQVTENRETKPEAPVNRLGSQLRRRPAPAPARASPAAAGERLWLGGSSSEAVKAGNQKGRKSGVFVARPYWWVWEIILRLFFYNYREVLLVLII